MPSKPSPPAGLQVPPNFLAQYAVMAQYGNTMLAVQAFERVLASVVMIAEQAAWARSRAPAAPLSAKAHNRRLRRSAMRINHLFHHASASEMRAELSGKLDEELLEEIEPLIEWRNFLAHRYLLARLGADSGGLTPKQSHLNELAELAEAFQAATRRVEAAGRAIANLLRVPEDLDEEGAKVYRDALSAHIRSLVFRQPAPFSRAQRRARRGSG